MLKLFRSCKMICLKIVFLLYCCLRGFEARSSGNAVKADQELSALITKLWKEDTNRLVFGKDIRLSYQNQASWTSARDVSNQPLFYSVNTNVFTKPTFKAFIAILDNYEYDITKSESISTHEINENRHFLNAVLRTPAMQAVYSYLRSKNKVSSQTQFKSKLYEMWFEMYYRSNVRGSSGFEHVFVGETKTRDSIVSGFHNWIQFYLQEKKGNLNYYGFLKTSRTSPYLSLVKYTWHNQIKHIGSAFFGTSPEFEFSLYSLVYMLGHEKLEFSLDGIKVSVKCFGMNRNRNIGTCYPDFG